MRATRSFSTVHAECNGTTVGKRPARVVAASACAGPVAGQQGVKEQFATERDFGGGEGIAFGDGHVQVEANRNLSAVHRRRGLRRCGAGHCEARWTHAGHRT